MKKDKLTDDSENLENKKKKKFTEDSANLENQVNNTDTLKKLEKEKYYNFLETEYVNRQEAPIVEDSLVALLVEEIIVLDNKEQKLITGQIGVARDGLEYEGEIFYSVYFFDFKQYVANLETLDTEEISYYSESSDLEQATFVVLEVPRRELLPLHSFVDMPFENTLNSEFLVNYKNFHEQGAPNNLQFFLQSEIHKLVNTSHLKDFQIGTLVTVLIDFMQVNSKMEFVVSVYAGEIGIVIDSQIDEIRKDNDEIFSTKLQSHEVMVYFPKIPLMPLFSVLKDSYKELEPFQANQCIVFNKAYLIRLLAEKPE